MTTVPSSRTADLAEGGEHTGALSADLRISLMRLVRRLRAEKSDADITDSQYGVLGLLDRHGPMTAAALASHERIKPPSMTRIVGSLLEAGLVERAAHPDDGRAQLVTLTPAGHAAVEETRRRRDEWLCHQLSRLSEADRRTLARATVLLQDLSES
jgi:DNA-binding MarR family transcriptional regulator